MGKRNPDAMALTWAMQSLHLRRPALELITKKLRASKGNVRAAARELGVSHKVLHRVIALSQELEKLTAQIRKGESKRSG